MKKDSLTAKLEGILLGADETEDNPGNVATKVVTSEKELEKLLTTKYSSAFNLFNEGLRFYRGSKEKEDVFEAEPQYRTARDSNNVYTLLLSGILPSWKDYPPRNKCIIMSDNIKDAVSYAPTAQNVHYIFPANGAKIAICPTPDMWDAFTKMYDKHRINDLRSFNNTIIDTLSDILYYDSPYYEPTKYGVSMEEKEKIIKSTIAAFNNNDAVTVMSLIDKCDDIVEDMSDEEMEKFFDSEVFYPLTEYIIKEARSGIGITIIIDSLLNPKNNGFKLVDIDEMTKAHVSPSHASEMWTDAECLFVRFKEK